MNAKKIIDENLDDNVKVTFIAGMYDKMSVPVQDAMEELS